MQEGGDTGRETWLGQGVTVVGFSWPVPAGTVLFIFKCTATNS